jgi:MYXO-CTERM domain-containing protein
MALTFRSFLNGTLLQVLLACTLGLLLPASARAAEYYVAVDGSDSAAGTMGAPFASVGRAQTAANAGDTVFIRGGRYAFSGSGTVGVSFTKSGKQDQPINYFAYAGEVPIFDLTDLTPSNRVTGLDVHCNWIHLRGLEVMGVHQYMSGQDSWGVRIQGSNNVLESLNVHNNDAPGVFITSGADNLVLNCDSHDNFDVLEDGGSGDGFGCHSSGGGNVLRGCRAYDNSDDGYDFINASGSCLVERSFSFRNGWRPGTSTAAGNGAGFKAGGYGSPPSVPSTGAAEHTVRQCVAFGNRAQGFYANHHPGRINFLNNTAFKNPVNYNMLADSGYPSDHVLRNNVAMATGTAISNLTGGTDTFNSWSLSVTVSAADFVSVTETDAEAMRAPDGGLPNNGFVRLAMGSDLIDQGTDVDLPFVGAAPDLGAFEFGATVDPGSGGTAGMSGSAGAPGAGRGGMTSVGGASAAGMTSAGGTTSAGGASVTAGAPGAGRGNSGGKSGSSGAPGSGGTTSTGGRASSAGAATMGGAMSATGGAGGAPGTGGSANPGSGGSSVAGSAAGDSGDASSGCSCRLGDASGDARPVALLLLAGVVWLRRRGNRAA